MMLHVNFIEIVIEPLRLIYKSYQIESSTLQIMAYGFLPINFEQGMGVFSFLYETMEEVVVQVSILYATQSQGGSPIVNVAFGGYE